MVNASDKASASFATHRGGWDSFCGKSSKSNAPAHAAVGVDLPHLLGSQDRSLSGGSQKSSSEWDSFTGYSKSCSPGIHSSKITKPKWDSFYGFSKEKKAVIAPLSRTRTTRLGVSHQVASQSEDSVKKAGDLEAPYVPGSARDLIQQRLHYIEVLSHLCGEFEWKEGLDKSSFVNCFRSLLAKRDMLDPLLPTEYDEAIEIIFDSSNCRETGCLSLEDLAIGLRVFFKGTCQDESRCLSDFQMSMIMSGQECGGCLYLKEYLLPIIRAMTPPEVLPFLPELVGHCANLVMDTVDLNEDLNAKLGGFRRWQMENQVLTYAEVNGWLCKHDMIDFLVRAVDAKVHDWNNASNRKLIAVLGAMRSVESLEKFKTQLQTLTSSAESQPDVVQCLELVVHIDCMFASQARHWLEASTAYTQ